MESFQITLNSFYADSKNNGTSECTFFLPELQLDAQSYLYVSVVNAFIPYSFYNINSSNNTFKYTVGGIHYTHNIQEGNYNIIEFYNYLKSILINVDIAYSKITNKFTFTSQYLFSFNVGSTCFQFLGFDPNQESNIESYFNTPKETIISHIPINLITYNYLYIYTNLTTYNFSKLPSSNRANLLCTIPIDTIRNNFIVHRRNTTFSSNTFSANIPDLKISICDKTGTPINLNGCDWSMTIQFDVVKFNDENDD